MIDQGKVESMDDRYLEQYLELNPGYYYPYFLVGECYRLKGNPILAEKMYDKALAKEVPRLVDREQVTEAKEDLKK